MADREKVLRWLAICGENMDCSECCPYLTEKYKDPVECMSALMRDALELLKEQSAIVDALLKVGYPHNFQREEPWIVNYMLNITDVIRKAINLRNAEEVKQDENIS